MKMKMMKTITITTFSITLLLASVVNSQNPCNGYVELCGKKFSDVSYPTTHNAYASGNSLAANQNFNISIQLKDGIRGFMLDAMYPNNTRTNEVHLCHHSCDLLDNGPAVDTLSLFASWLNNNPNEVITILWENAGKVPAATFSTIYSQSGLAKFSHFQPVDEEWPTLSKMIESGKRAVNFIDTGADPKALQVLMPEYDYVFETPFQNTDINAFQCTIDRGKQNSLYVLNHFIYGTIAPPSNSGGEPIDFPQAAKAPTVNGPNLASHAKLCQQTFNNKIPNFVAVDFYDQGSSGQNVFSAVADLNGVKYTPKVLGDGSKPASNDDGKGKGTSFNNAAEVRNVNANILVGMAGFGAMAMFVL